MLNPILHSIVQQKGWKPWAEKKKSSLKVEFTLFLVAGWSTES